MTIRCGLEGRTVLITGAAGGIGQALARGFAAQGARLMLLDRAAEPLQALVEQLRLQGADAHAVVCRLGDDASVTAAATQVDALWGRLDVLVHNAGTEYPTPVDDPSADANDRWAALLDNNVSGMWRLTRALLPSLPRGASVIHQSSIWGRIGVAGFSAYSARFLRARPCRSCSRPRTWPTPSSSWPATGRPRSPASASRPATAR